MNTAEIHPSTRTPLEKRLETLAANREILHEDIVSLHARGAVPLAIATMVDRSETYVLEVLREAGVKVPRYLRNDLEGMTFNRGDGYEVPELPPLPTESL